MSVVIVGQGRIGTLLARALPEAHVVQRGAPIPVAATTWLCVGEDDLPGVWAALPEASRAGCVLVQNGLLASWLARYGGEGVTQGVLYVAVPARDGLAAASAESVFHGPRAEQAVEVWRALRLAARAEPTRAGLARSAAAKLAWISAFGVLCARAGGTVGEVLAREEALLQALLEELVPVLSAAHGVALEPSHVAEEVRAYARTIPGWRAGLKALPWRNGALLAAAARYGLPSPLHARLLEEARVDTAAASRSADTLLYSSGATLS